jgi:SAM-dependent methyltransferase
MHEASDTVDRYERIWAPYLSFSRHFIAEHGPGRLSYLRLGNEIANFQAIFHDESLRDQSPSPAQWKAMIAEADGANVYNKLFFDLEPFWFPKIAHQHFWRTFATSFIVNHAYQSPRVFLDLGCGVGEILFNVHDNTLQHASRYVGIDNSATAIECASLRAGLLDGEAETPDFAFGLGDIHDLEPASLECGGRDVVVFSVSGVNKIKHIRDDYFDMQAAVLVDAGSVDFIHIETTGWQIYQDEGLAGFYAGLGATVQGLDLTEAPRFEAQGQWHVDNGGNLNLMSVIMNAARSGRVGIQNIFMNYFSPNPRSPYSVIHLKLKT